MLHALDALSALSAIFKHMWMQTPLFVAVAMLDLFLV
jgi:hypothetical protein